MHGLVDVAVQERRACPRWCECRGASRRSATGSARHELHVIGARGERGSLVRWTATQTLIGRRCAPVRLRRRWQPDGFDLDGAGGGREHERGTSLERAREGAPEGTVVVAESQTAGRGRQGRSWESPPRAGLTFSVLLRPPQVSGWLPLLAGLSVAVALREQAGVDAGVKWPNDVLVEDLRSRPGGRSPDCSLRFRAGRGRGGHRNRVERDDASGRTARRASDQPGARRCAAPPTARRC